MVDENAYVDVSTLFSGHSRRLTGARGMMPISPANGFPPTLFLGHSSCSPAIFVPRRFLFYIFFPFPRHIKEREKESRNSEPFWNVEHTRQQPLWPLKVRWTMVLASFFCGRPVLRPFLPLHSTLPFPSTLRFSCIVLLLVCFILLSLGLVERWVYHSVGSRRFGFLIFFFFFFVFSSLSILVQVVVGLSR